MTAPERVRGNFVGGAEVLPRGEEMERRNPADRSRIVSRHRLSDAEDVGDAVAAATDAAPAWGDLPGPARARILHAVASALEAQAAAAASEITEQEGKTLAEARGEVARTVALFRFYAELARSHGGRVADSEEHGTLVMTAKRPLGVVGLITPWNFPLAIPARKAGAALAAGNCVVLKPSVLAASPSLRLARLAVEAGLPDGVLNVVVGAGAVAGDALVGDDRIAAISFTGSTATGERIARRAEACGARVQLEMGGHSPAVVLADADLDTAAAAVAVGAFASAGQICTATRRVIAEGRIHDELVDRIQQRTSELRVGDGAAPDTDVPPLVGIPERDAVNDRIAAATRTGVVPLVGGRVDGDVDSGAFARPTMLLGMRPEMDCAREEIFGPVCGVIEAADEQQALSHANAGPFGLAASIFSRDIGRVLRLVRELEAGMIHVNRPTVGADPHMPFGGVKDSGRGPREQGAHALGFFSSERTIYVRG